MSVPGGLVVGAERVADDQRTPAQRSTDERDWSFGGAWPYAPRWHRADGVRLHYVDEGPCEASAVVMLHGNPTWAFLYRAVIARLSSAGMRSIAPDQLGFGRSDKPHRMREYSLSRHCRLFDSLLERLALRDVIIVAHDWGGPVALSWAARHSDRIAGLVLLNTFVRPPDRGAALTSRLLAKGAHRSLHAAVWADRAAEHFSAHERLAYTAPHPSWDSRTGILALERAGAGKRSVDTYVVVDATIDGLVALRHTPTVIGWGLDDPTLPTSCLAELRAVFPDARVHELVGVGHLVPESESELVAGAILGLRTAVHA